VLPNGSDRAGAVGGGSHATGGVNVLWRVRGSRSSVYRRAPIGMAAMAPAANPPSTLMMKVPDMTTEQQKRILDEARATIAARLDAAAGQSDDGFARWNALRKAHQEPEPEGGATMAAPEPPPAPVAANPDPDGWNAWFRANYDAAQAEQSQISPFLTELLGDLIAHERHEFDKALAQERRQFELALAKLRTELCQQMTDTIGRIERVISSDRIARGVEREAADRRAAGEPDKALN
jgi:hypothetical protein